MNETFSFIVTIILTGGITTSVIWIVLKKLGDTFIQSGLKKYEYYLDKQKLAFEIQYNKKTTKETEAIQQIYESLSSFIIFIFREILVDEKIFKTNDDEVWDTLKKLKMLRNNFIDSYEPNKIYLPRQLCAKIEESNIKIDKFIRLYDDGIPFKSRLDYIGASLQMEEGENTFIGMWESTELEISKQELEKIKDELEIEFRKVYEK
jgi:hypothetical protein